MFSAWFVTTVLAFVVAIVLAKSGDHVLPWEAETTKNNILNAAFILVALSWLGYTVYTLVRLVQLYVLP